MATNTLNTRILLKGDTAANWANSTLVLLKNEIAIESDTRKIKIGNGTNTFPDLSYANLTPEEVNALITPLNAAKHTHSNKAVIDATTASFTTELLNKLNGIATGAQVNQNAFSKVTVGSTTVEADSPTDTLTLVGSNVTITPDTTNDKITISVANGTTSAKGIVQLTNSTSSTSTTTAATPSSVKSAYDLASEAKTAATTALNDAKSYTDTKVADLVGSAPETMDTLAEVAAAIEAHQDVTDALNAAIGNKVDKVSGKGLSTNDYTTAEKNKLAGIATGAEVNQNAFSNIVVGDVTVAADTKTDTLTLVAGTNVTITPDATNDKVTIAAKDTTYSAGTGISLSGTTINHSNSITAGTAQGDANKTLKFGGTFTVPTVTYDAQGHITGKGTTTMTMPATPTSVSGNAGSATKLATARTIAMSGGATGTATSFNGTANITIPVTSLNTDYLTNGSNTLIFDCGASA